ncbi:MAG: protein kinase [Deltaproteobacteria bacterium]|nr:protein kinase [Deltaproteobacteria bacterium]
MAEQPVGSSSLGTTAPVTQSSGAFTPPKIGATLGRYQILATIGHGAMATVFRARDPQLGRDVALKVMGMAHAARGGATERFHREAHAVAALRHPGIVEIYDFVEATETEPSYIVAELIEGPTLRKLIEAAGGRLLPEFAALIALPLVEALAVAHERGVIHRDVKPDNVMVESSGKSSRVVLTDFGVAHITGLESMTATGAMVGSPAYMSPEQARGHDVGPATDLWSVGTTLYEMVTGVVPFAGKDPYTVIAAILRGVFRPPSQIVATVGPDFEAMVTRCLKARPGDRYPSAAALAADLRAFAQASGLVPEAEALRRYIDERDTAIAELRPRVAEAAMARARQHARRGQLARALAEIGHATAYVPDHPGANRLLKRLSAGRNAIRAVMVLAALVCAGAVFWLAKPLLVPKPPVPAIPPAAKISPPRPPIAPPSTAPPSTAPQVAPSSPAPVPPARVTGTEPRRVAKSAARARSGRRPLSPAQTPAVAPVEAPTPPPVVPAPTVEPAPPPARETAPPHPGTIALFAKGGFCYPSLDEHPAASLMPVFRNVPPGKHKIYCSRTKSSPRQFAGEVDLPPGAHIERTVTEQGGRLTIARPR